jgi:hypothetical protein
MHDPTIPASLHIGFLTVFAEANGYLGGYLVTNSWGRPLEFRLSTAVQPNKVQQILYGNSLAEYLCADLIGKTLIDKTATPIHLLVTDTLDVLPIRSRIDVPVIAAIPQCQAPTAFTHSRSSIPLVGNEESVRSILDRLDAALDLAEPFVRIREAMGEARKMGVTSRAA